MKKVCVLFFCAIVSYSSYAQLKVKSNGYVVSGTELLSSTTFDAAFQAGLQTPTSQRHAAIYAKADNVNGAGHAYGVYAVACNGFHGCNFGIMGATGMNDKGVGVLGCTFPHAYTGFDAKYAGYFWGDTHVSGTFNATSIVQSSDIRLKENIVPINKQKGSVLDKVLDLTMNRSLQNLYTNWGKFCIKHSTESTSSTFHVIWRWMITIVK